LVEGFINDGCKVIAEPGRFFVEGAFVVVCRIFSVRVGKDGRREYFVTQGVEGVFKDVVLCDEVFTPIPFKESGQLGEEVECIVRGPGGEEDVVARCKVGRKMTGAKRRQHAHPTATMNNH
jgi:ornithine decarboxylase